MAILLLLAMLPLPVSPLLYLLNVMHVGFTVCVSVLLPHKFFYTYQTCITTDTDWLTVTYCLWFQTALCHWGPVWVQASPTGPLWAWWCPRFHSAGRCRWHSPTDKRAKRHINMRGITVDISFTGSLPESKLALLLLFTNEFVQKLLHLNNDTLRTSMSTPTHKQTDRHSDQSLSRCKQTGG